MRGSIERREERRGKRGYTRYGREESSDRRKTEERVYARARDERSDST